MKNIIINKCMNYIKKKTIYNEEKLYEIKYGLESIYLSITKILIVLFIGFILGILKEVTIFLLLYNILRIPSYGMHATKSWICLLSSTILFIGIPIISNYIFIRIELKIITCIIGIILMFKNSPADTYKRPIVSKKRRQKFKFISTVLVIIYSYLILFIKDNFIANSLMLAIILQNCMISPMFYKIFRLPYNNYINYIKKHPELSYD